MLLATDFIEMLPVLVLQALKDNFLRVRDWEQAEQPPEEKRMFSMLRIIP